MYILLMICTSFMCLSWINSFFTMYTPKCQWGRPTWKARQSSKCSIPSEGPAEPLTPHFDSNWSKTFSFKISSTYHLSYFQTFHWHWSAMYEYLYVPICQCHCMTLLYIHLLTYQKSKAKLICLFVWNMDFSFILGAIFIFRI